jgi:hypothetical protein
VARRARRPWALNDYLIYLTAHAPWLHPVQDMQPLQILSKTVYWDPRPGMGVVMLLTVHNPNNFPVTFEANHVRICDAVTVGRTGHGERPLAARPPSKFATVCADTPATFASFRALHPRTVRAMKHCTGAI